MMQPQPVPMGPPMGGPMGPPPAQPPQMPMGPQAGPQQVQGQQGQQRKLELVVSLCLQAQQGAPRQSVRNNQLQALLYQPRSQIPQSPLRMLSSLASVILI